MPRFQSRLVKLILAAAMAVTLPITLAGEAVALAFDGKPLGSEVGTATDVFAWLFTAAFVAIFILMVVDQDRMMRARGAKHGSAR
ncbi:MAG TPA: hypothetical protein VN655_01335 [Pseudolabrys sp.]|jgi:hypothetical protein|nr:hypothetical protein [Pseudolabrys sp.]